MRLTNHRLSDGIAEEKVKSIIATSAPVVATGCPGCRMQITDALQRAGSDVAVLHPVQVLEEALGNAEFVSQPPLTPVSPLRGED